MTEEQIAFALRRAEGGTPLKEVCRKLGVTEQTFYRWKKKFGGVGVTEILRLKQLEEENRSRSSWWRISRRVCTGIGVRKPMS